MDFKNSETRLNLMKAFAGESQARNRYTYMAKKAKEQGHDMLEKVCLFTADQERAHGEVFYNHLKELAGENLSVEGTYPVDVYDDLSKLFEAAAHNEMEEYESVYPEFARVARKEGFEKVAVDFEHIAGIEHVHANRFKNILVKLNSQGLYKDSATQNWMCLNCGFIYEGMQVPNMCPVCSYDQGYFVRLAYAPYTSE